VISFRDLLEIFFTIHDPTTLNRQGGDIGTQYRSVIFYQDALQKQIAEEVISTLESHTGISGSVVTQIAEAVPFWPAEVYHQNYFAQHPGQGYCQIVIAPKLNAFRKKFLR
jgi:peptide-methionine (S)-S-oxide reductase